MLLMSALLALADPVPQTVYTRPGGTRAQVERDVQRCRIITTGPATNGERPDGAARLDNGALAVTPADTIDGCMATYGWHLHILSEHERQSWCRRAPPRSSSRKGS